MSGVQKMLSEGLSREDIAAIGYAKLKSTCSGLFKKPGDLHGILLPP